MALKDAVLRIVAAGGEAGMTVDEIVAAARLLPRPEPVVRDDVAPVLKALVRAAKLNLRGGPRSGRGSYRYHVAANIRP